MFRRESLRTLVVIVLLVLAASLGALGAFNHLSQRARCSGTSAQRHVQATSSPPP